MRKTTTATIWMLTFLFTLATATAAWADNSNTEDDREIVAVVNGEEIFFDELMDSVAARHQNMAADTQTAWVGFEGALERLIDTKLILQEARDIGLDERPEIRDGVKIYAETLLLRILKNGHLQGLEADEADIERIYSDRVRNWKYRALVFEDIEKAREFKEEVGDTGDYEALGQRYVEEGLAAWDGEERQARERDIAPEIVAAFSGQDVGYVTPVIKAVRRYFVFKLTGVTYPEDAASRQKAESMALELKKEKVLEAYGDSLARKYVTVQEGVLDTVGKGDFSDMEKDARIIAQVAGEAPVLVSDLIAHLKGKFYHGEKATQYKKTLSEGPEKVLNEVLEERVFIKEARELGLDKTERYIRSVTEYENSLLFGLYLEKFLAPQARVPEEDVKAAYEARSEEFLMSQSVEVDSVAFSDGKNASIALERLKRGADLDWISENTPGLAQEGHSHEELVLDTLPADLQEQMAGVQPGDTGIYDTGEGLYKVYVVRQVPPRQVKPYEAVRYQIAKELFGVRLKKAIEDLTAELRGLSEITVYKDILDQGPLTMGRDKQ